MSILHNRFLRIALLVFAVVLVALVNLRVSEAAAATLLGVSTFLFGTFTAYVVSHRQSRMVGIRSRANDERSVLLNYYYLTQPLKDEKYKKKMIDSIESYIQATQIHHVAYYHNTNYAFENLAKTVSECEKKTPEGSAAFGSDKFKGAVVHQSAADKSTTPKNTTKKK